jgi:hypothetical protein
MEPQGQLGRKQGRENEVAHTHRGSQKFDLLAIGDQEDWQWVGSQQPLDRSQPPTGFGSELDQERRAFLRRFGFDLRDGSILDPGDSERVE